MAGSQRLKRMADTVQRELSELIRQGLKDPRLGGLVTISAVKVSPDLGYAEVYVTVMGRELGDEQSQEANKETLDVLNKASGFLRHALRRRIKTRITPPLRFPYDKTNADGNYMSGLIAEAVKDLTEAEATKDDEEVLGLKK